LLLRVGRLLMLRPSRQCGYTAVARGTLASVLARIPWRVLANKLASASTKQNRAKPSGTKQNQAKPSILGFALCKTELRGKKWWAHVGYSRFFLCGLRRLG
jgi:hypothetical protein